MLHAELSADDIYMRSLNAMDITAHMRLLFATARVNGDVRDALQCLRFDGYKTGLLCRRWHVGDASAFTPAQQRAKSEMKRHFNAIVESKEQGLQRLDPALYQPDGGKPSWPPTARDYLCRHSKRTSGAWASGASSKDCARHSGEAAEAVSTFASRAGDFCTPPPRV